MKRFTVIIFAALPLALFAASPAHAHGIKHQVQELEMEVETLQSEVSTLQTENSGLASEVSMIRKNPALKLGPYVSVDPNSENGLVGPNLIFKGVNVHIESGSGATVDTTGLGNLVIGYDEDSVNSAIIDENRTGSHNLIIGPDHQFTASGTIIGGYENFTSANYASITGGECNSAGPTEAKTPCENTDGSSDAASVSGGDANIASGTEASISGGQHNIASNFDSSVSGGEANKATGDEASVSGGGANTASGIASSVSGGSFSTASGGAASVSGGDSNIASGGAASVSGGELNAASGSAATVSGGGGADSSDGNTAGFDFSSVGGGQGQSTASVGQNIN